MLADTGIDWTQVMLGLIAAIPGTFAVYLSYRIHRLIRTPSGNRIGALVESTNELAIVNTEMTKRIHENTNGATDEKE